MKIFKIIIIIALTPILFANTNTSVTGDVSYYYMQRLHNSSVVNVPFRMLNLNINHQNNNFDIVGTFSLEYRNRKDIDFVNDSDPVDINTVLRELYLTYYLENGEISLGKKLYTWGSVDENCPIDVLNAYDYYYLLQGTSERKLGSYAISFDYYINNGTMKLSGIYAPLHNANRYPIDDEQYEFGLPISLDSKQMVQPKRPAEMGFSIQQSFNRGDFIVSHYRGYSRSPSISAIAQYEYFEKKDTTIPADGILDTWTGTADFVIDYIYNYDYIEANNIGGTFLFDDFTVRYDYGMFSSIDNTDLDTYTKHPCHVAWGASCEPRAQKVYKYVLYRDGGVFNSNTLEYDGGTPKVYPFNVKAKYTQKTIQVEMPLPDDYQLNLQYFKYEFDNNAFEFTPPTDQPLETLPNIDLSEFNDYDTLLRSVYSPGMGAPFSMISNESCFISIEKTLLEDDLKLTLSSLMDLDRGYGELISLEGEYNIGNGLVTTIGLTKILGDNLVSDYVFNQLEDFSHIRCELKYSF